MAAYGDRLLQADMESRATEVPDLRGRNDISASGTLPGIVRRAKLDAGLLTREEIRTLQRTIGNRAVAQLLKGDRESERNGELPRHPPDLRGIIPSRLQFKANLTIGAPDEVDGKKVQSGAKEVSNSAVLLRRSGFAGATELAEKPVAGTLRRQPRQSTVHAGKDVKQLPQGAGGSGAIIYEYTARAMREPPDKGDPGKPGNQFEIDLPLLVYAPANIDTTVTPPKVNIFVFFHGMRATYEEGTKTQAAQGEEPIAEWTHLKEAVAGTSRLGIAPQAPRTWVFSNRLRLWTRSTAQWYEALGKVGFDGLIKTALEGLSKDLGLATPLVAGDIHVAGHSAGGQGIIRATSHGDGASTFSDAVQDVTLQDAGYGFKHWEHLTDWLLDGSPGKTVRVLVSEAGGGTAAKPGDTRSVLTNSLNIKKINESIAAKKKSDDLEAVEVAVPKPEDQIPRPGGFVLESQMVIKTKKAAGVTQGTIVVFFSPGGKHYPTAGASMAAAAGAGPGTTTDFLGEATLGKYRVIGDQNEKIPLFGDKDLNEKKFIASLARDTVIEVTALEINKPAGPKDKATQPYVANIKTADGRVGWMRLANLTRE